MPSKNALHAERYVLSVKNIIIMQECVGVKACMMCSRKLMNLNLRTMTFFIGTIDHKGRDKLLVDIVIQDSHTMTDKIGHRCTSECNALNGIQALGKDPKKT